MTKDASNALLAVCIRMIAMTGGHELWTGETAACLKEMEEAVALAEDQKELPVAHRQFETSEEFLKP